MSAHTSLSSEELDFIRHVFDSPLNGKSLPFPSYTIDGGPSANALLARLGTHAGLCLEARLDDCRMSFPLQLVEDELHGLHLEMGAPSIYQEGAVRRPWRVTLDTPLRLHRENGEDAGLRVLELSPHGLVLEAANDDLPGRFALWLPLAGNLRLPIRGERIRRIAPRRAAYRLQLQHDDHVERLRQFIFEQYRQRHPELRIGGWPLS